MQLVKTAAYGELIAATCTSMNPGNAWYEKGEVSTLLPVRYRPALIDEQGKSRVQEEDDLCFRVIRHLPNTTLIKFFFDEQWR